MWRNIPYPASLIRFFVILIVNYINYNIQLYLYIYYVHIEIALAFANAAAPYTILEEKENKKN